MSSNLGQSGWALASRAWREWIHAASFICCFAALVAWTPFAHSDPIAALYAEMAGSWIVAAEGEDRTRTLKILGVLGRSGDSVSLDAEYGWTAGGKVPIRAELVLSSRERRLTFTTPPGTRVVATQGADGVFSGTFALRNGVVKRVTLSRVAGEKLDSIQRAELNAIPVSQSPGPDVPAACASFLGGWLGVSPRVGRVWLWVVSVDARCMARYAFVAGPRLPREYAVTEIKSGILTVLQSGGAEYFEANGDELRWQFPGLGGLVVSNMEKVLTSGDIVAQLRAEHHADLRDDLVGTWEVEIANENRTLTLAIEDLEQVDDKEFILGATFGWTGTRGGVMRAGMQQTSQDRKLVLPIQGGSEITATQQPDGTFRGAFTNNLGATKPVKLRRLSKASTDRQ